MFHPPDSHLDKPYKNPKPQDICIDKTINGIKKIEVTEEDLDQINNINISHKNEMNQNKEFKKNNNFP